MPTIQKIMFLATIRRAIDTSFAEEDVHNGIYFDVMSKIDLPSDGGDYSDYDAVAMVSKKQAEFMQSILDPEMVKIAYVCL